MPCPPAAPLRLAALLLLAAAACGPDAAHDGPWLEEVSAAAGLAVPLTCGGVDKQTILEVNGNGAALADLDGDGDLDVVLVDGTTRERFAAWVADGTGPPVRHHVLLNVGVTDGVPRLVPAADHGLEGVGWPTGITAGDVDEDGRVDLVIGGLGADTLYLNRTASPGPTGSSAGDEARVRFEARPLPGRRGPLDWTTSVALADADGDGHLDLYLVRYLEIDPADPPLGALVDEASGQRVPCRFQGHDVMCGPQGLPPQPDVLLRGDGRGGFADITAAAGLDVVPPRYGLGLLFADLDDDGRPDLYVANDSVDNTLLHNRGDGTFEDVSSLSGAASDMGGRAQAGMGVDLGDVDGDGRFDLAVTNFSDETNALYRSLGPLQFRDATASAGLAAASRPMLGWGVVLADLDADGQLDLFVANGHVYPQADLPGTGTAYAQPCQWFPGVTGSGSAGAPRFGPDAFPDDRPHKGRAALAGDLDDDGDLELLVLTLDGPPLLYLNRTDDPSRHLAVSLSDGPREAFGATLTLTWTDADGATRSASRQKLSARGFQSSGDPRLHFALPPGATLDAAEVRWPGGERQQVVTTALPLGHHVVLDRQGGPAPATPLGARP